LTLRTLERMAKGCLCDQYKEKASGDLWGQEWRNQRGSQGERTRGVNNGEKKSPGGPPILLTFERGQFRARIKNGVIAGHKEKIWKLETKKPEMVRGD